jgi:putative transposase
MRLHRLAGVHRRRWRHGQRSEAVWPDHVKRRFVAEAPDRLWVTDITQHRTGEGWIYAAVVLDVFSRRVVGLVERRPPAHRTRRRRPRHGPLAPQAGRHDRALRPRHPVHIVAVRLPPTRGRTARLDGQSRLRLRQQPHRVLLRLDADRAARPPQLAHSGLAGNAIFEWIEAFYNPVRRHSALSYRSPIEFERLHTATPEAA